MLSAIKQIVGLRSKLPYPIAIKARDVTKEPRVHGGGFEAFETDKAEAINRARIEHLDSLGLSIEGKSVIDVGCGIGLLAQYFVQHHCRVTCVDSRTENIDELKRRYPSIDAHTCDAQSTDLRRFGIHDIVFCYGLLYHLESPMAALRNLSVLSGEVLLLETLVCDYSAPMLIQVDEPNSFNQADQGLGCRPSPSYVVMGLNRSGFPYVYAPSYPPNYEDFKFIWKNNMRHWENDHPLRCIFIASRKPIESPKLVPLI